MKWSRWHHIMSNFRSFIISMLLNRKAKRCSIQLTKSQHSFQNIRNIKSSLTYTKKVSIKRFIGDSVLPPSINGWKQTGQRLPEYSGSIIYLLNNNKKNPAALRLRSASKRDRIE